MFINYLFLNHPAFIPEKFVKIISYRAYIPAIKPSSCRYLVKTEKNHIIC